MFQKVIKAIPTEYNGHLFRSRLEAKWAVFFDCLGVYYQYEPEGYETSRRYLPDFYLPSCNSFIEVKPENHTNKYEKRYDELAIGTKNRLLLVMGEPIFGQYKVQLYPIIEAFSYNNQDFIFVKDKDIDGIIGLQTKHTTPICLNPVDGHEFKPIIPFKEHRKVIYNTFGSCHIGELLNNNMVLGSL